MEMNIQKYLAFVRTVELGSFTKAAEELSYSQSGMSRMIADLEHDWNVTLLERNRTGVRLTAEGTALLPFMRSICEDYRKLMMQVDGLNGLATGVIRIGIFSSVAQNWLPGIISRFQKDYPAIGFEMLVGNYEETERWIREGRVDCGFLMLPGADDLDVIPLDTDEFMAVLPKDHPMAGSASVPASILCEMPFMMLGQGTGKRMSDMFEQKGLTPDIRFVTVDDYVIMSMVESGLGVSILPSLILQRVSYDVAIVPLDEPIYREIGLAMRNRESASLATKRFIEYLNYRSG